MVRGCIRWLGVESRGTINLARLTDVVWVIGEATQSKSDHFATIYHRVAKRSGEKTFSHRSISFDRAKINIKQ